MAIFESKEKCVVCNNESGKIKIANGSICKKCLKKCGEFIDDSVNIRGRVKEEIVRAIELNEENERRNTEFVASRKIETYIEIDEEKKQWRVCGSKSNKIIYDYGDVKSFELVEDNEVISKGGFGKKNYEEITPNTSRTFINKIVINVKFEGEYKSDITIDVLSTELNINSNMYKNLYATIKEMMDFLNSMQKGITREEEYQAELDCVDDILKLDSMLKDGEITEDYYNLEINKILGF